MSHGEATGNQVDQAGGGRVALLKYAAIILLVIGPLSGIPFFLGDPLTATRGALRVLYALLVLFDIVVGIMSIFILVRLASAPDFERWKKLCRWASIVSTGYMVGLIGNVLITGSFWLPSYLVKICIYFLFACLIAKAIVLALKQNDERFSFRQSFAPLLMKYSANVGFGVIIGFSVGLLRLFILGKIPLDAGAFHMVGWSRALLAWLIGIVAVILIGLLMTGISRAVNMAFVDAHGLIGQTFIDRDVTLAWADMGTPRHKRFLQHDYLLVPAASGRSTIWLQAPIHQSEDFRAAVRQYAPAGHALAKTIEGE